MSVQSVYSAKCDFPGCKAAEVPNVKMSALELRIYLAKQGWEYIAKGRGEHVEVEPGYPGRGRAGGSYQYVGRTKSADLCPEHFDRGDELDLSIPDRIKS